MFCECGGRAGRPSVRALSDKTKVRTRDGSAKPLLFRRGGAGGIRYERGADSAEDRAASSGQTVPQNSAYDGLFRLFRHLVGTISCRLRTSETGDRPRESSAFLPTAGAGRCARAPRWGARGRNILLRRIRCRRGGLSRGCAFSPGRILSAKNRSPLQAKGGYDVSLHDSFLKKEVSRSPPPFLWRTSIVGIKTSLRFLQDGNTGTFLRGGEPPIQGGYFDRGRNPSAGVRPRKRQVRADDADTAGICGKRIIVKKRCLFRLS